MLTLSFIKIKIRGEFRKEIWRSTPSLHFVEKYVISKFSIEKCMKMQFPFKNDVPFFIPIPHTIKKFNLSMIILFID